ncbi:hypothetical protein Tco_1379073 [Tanacetum coccineum]
MEGKGIAGLAANGGSSSIFTFFNLPARAELVLEAEEPLLPLAGAEEGLFIVIPFKVLALNMDFDFKIDDRTKKSMIRWSRRLKP